MKFKNIMKMKQVRQLSDFAKKLPVRRTWLILKNKAHQIQIKKLHSPSFKKVIAPKLLVIVR